MPRQALIERSRLLTRLADRFDKRLIVVRAGAGFGKTTLLGQALAANDAGLDGNDVWIDVTVEAVATHGLASLVMQSLGHDTDQPTIEAIANAVLQRAPQQVALIFDNVHRIADDGNEGLFEELLARLPSNGHLVIASRTEPPLRFRRLLASGDADLLTEEDLTFDAADIESFARARQVDSAALGESGWPALAELRALDQPHDERRYVAEEVLEGIDPPRLQALRRLALLGSFDDRDAEFVGGYSGSVDELVSGLPLTSRTPTGHVVLHDLWPTWLPALSAAEHRDVCARIAETRSTAGDLVGAFAMFCNAEQFDQASVILRTFACDYNTELGIAQRHELLAAIPDELRDDPAVRLIEADLSFVVNPQSAELPLRRALAAAEQVDDQELIAQIMLRQAETLYRSQDASRLVAQRHALSKLAPDHMAVRAVQQLVDIWIAMSLGHTGDVAERIGQRDVLTYAPTSLQAMSYRGLALGQNGDMRRSRAALDELPPMQGRHAAIVAGFRTIMHFIVGEMDAAGRSDVRSMVTTIKDSQSTHTFVGGSAATSIYHFSAGDVATARSLLNGAADVVDALPEGAWARVGFQVAQAFGDLVNGDEESAATRLERALPAGEEFERLARHIVYMAIVPSYLLLPRVRAFFDADECGPDFAFGRQIARALVALREDDDASAAAALPWNELERIRPWVTEPHLIELVVGALTKDQPAALTALSAIKYDPHAGLNLIQQRYGGAMTKAAASLLRETPERPTSVIRLEVLGDTRLVIDGTVLGGSELRSRVIELLHLLVEHRRISRDEVMFALWPGLDPARARNNLRVNLSLLVRLLEPNRGRGAVPWHIRSEGEHIALASTPLLQVDVDDFVEAMNNAQSFERQGRPLDARGEYVRAVELYRGDYFARTIDSDVGFDTRVRLRLDFVEAATRAAALLTASDLADKAVSLALRAIEVEPLDETGHIALLAALRAADRLDEHGEAALKCDALFRSEGLTPTPALERLLR